MAIIQSNYIPWKGYFDVINSVDTFIFYDDAQYTKRDWRNRNTIKTSQGLQWLTVPVKVKGRFHQKVKEVELAEDGWQQDHLKAIQFAYAKAPHFKEVFELLKELYLSRPYQHLSQVNHSFISGINKYLGIKTKLEWSSNYKITSEDPNEKLLQMCVQSRCTTYVSGPSAQSYLDSKSFGQHKIAVEYFDYSTYPEYPQLHGDFTHTVSIVDLLMNAGPHAPDYLKSFAKKKPLSAAA